MTVVPVVPDASETRPPCAFAIARTIDGPSPVPPRLRSVAKNGLNAFD